VFPEHEEDEVVEDIVSTIPATSCWPPMSASMLLCV
jgi:hypothetical protein